MRGGKPSTVQGDLANLPEALAPLLERPQWAVWKWTQRPDGSWQKPPYQALEPDRFASTTDSDSWAEYSVAFAAVQRRHADGITYILTKDDALAAIDLDHCRDLVTQSIDRWGFGLHR